MEIKDRIHVSLTSSVIFNCYIINLGSTVTEISKSEAFCSVDIDFYILSPCQF